MTKAPRAGKVKTRLTPPLTPDEASELNVRFLRDIVSAFAPAMAGGGAQGIGVYTPPGEEDAFNGILPEQFQLVAQRGEQFGDRLAFAMEDLLRLGFDSACLINSDSPTVPPHAFVEAVEVLSVSGDRMVLGPSDDGGYYLIGLKQLHRRIFADIDWSTERVFEQTLQRAIELGLAVHLLPKWYDVDDRAALHRLCDELFDGKSGSTTDNAPATREFLSGIIKREGRARIWPELAAAE
jgi:rSAM/selenodomain-associated transferase 1